jgi:predicted nucleic-acid-binding Zn-ribbon protein
MINKDFTLYPEALELKQLGFDEPCLGFYERNQELIIQECEVTDFHKDSLQCVAPTYSQVFRWFREKYKLKYCIIPLVCEQGYSDLYESRIHQEKHSISRIGNYKIYEEAELACLREMIKIIKEKQK